MADRLIKAGEPVLYASPAVLHVDDLDPDVLSVAERWGRSHQEFCPFYALLVKSGTRGYPAPISARTKTGHHDWPSPVLGAATAVPRLSTIRPGRMLISMNTVSEEFVGGPTVLVGLAAYAKVEYLPFSTEVAEANARTIHPDIQIARLSCTTKEGLDAWLRWIDARALSGTKAELVR